MSRGYNGIERMLEGRGDADTLARLEDVAFVSDPYEWRPEWPNKRIVRRRLFHTYGHEHLRLPPTGEHCNVMVVDDPGGPDASEPGAFTRAIEWLEARIAGAVGPAPLVSVAPFVYDPGPVEHRQSPATVPWAELEQWEVGSADWPGRAELGDGEHQIIIDAPNGDAMVTGVHWVEDGPIVETSDGRHHTAQRDGDGWRVTIGGEP